MTEIFNKHSFTGSGFKNNGLMCPYPPSAKNNVGIYPPHSKGFISGNTINTIGDISTVTLNTVDNLASINGLFWKGQNKAVYMDFLDTKRYFKFSPAGINYLKNSGGIQNSRNLANTNINGPINAINSIFNKPIANLKYTEFSFSGGSAAKPFTVGQAVSHLNLLLTTHKVGNYLFDYKGNSHTKDGIDLIFELIGYLGPVGAAYSISYNMIDQYYDGGVTGYANDIKRFFTDFKDDFPLFLKYAGNKISDMIIK